jgi:hypothetical protein
MGNDEGSYTMWAEAAQECYDATDAGDSHEERIDDARHELAQMLEARHDEARPEVTNDASVWADLLSHSLGLVDWYEIAESLLEDVEQDAPGEPDAEPSDEVVG